MSRRGPRLPYRHGVMLFWRGKIVVVRLYKYEESGNIPRKRAIGVLFAFQMNSFQFTKEH